MSKKTIEPRKGMPDPHLAEAEFKQRFIAQLHDPAFDPLAPELAKLAAAAWDGYAHHRKSPRTRKAGSGFAESDYHLAVEWIS